VTDLREAQMIVPRCAFRRKGTTPRFSCGRCRCEPRLPERRAECLRSILPGPICPREATSAAFFDVAQLEILPGSQGTLYWSQRDRRNDRDDAGEPEFNY